MAAIGAPIWHSFCYFIYLMKDAEPVNHYATFVGLDTAVRQFPGDHQMLPAEIGYQDILIGLTRDLPNAGPLGDIGSVVAVGGAHSWRNSPLPPFACSRAMQQTSRRPEKALCVLRARPLANTTFVKAPKAGWDFAYKLHTPRVVAAARRARSGDRHEEFLRLHAVLGAAGTGLGPPCYARCGVSSMGASFSAQGY